MNYDPNNTTLIDDLRRSQQSKDAEIVQNRMQDGLTKYDSKLKLSDMEFVVTHRNATSYYKCNDKIYGCYMCSDWHLESRNADKWIREQRVSFGPSATF